MTYTMPHLDYTTLLDKSQLKHMMLSKLCSRLFVKCVSYFSLRKALQSDRIR